MPLSQVVKDSLTCADGESYDVGRVVGVFGVLVFCGLSVANWRHFDPQTFGIGFGSICTGVGALLWAKKDTEPKP